MRRSSKSENLIFVHAMLKEARNRALATGEEVLAYLIEMACLEAADRLREKGYHDVEHSNAS